MNEQIKQTNQGQLNSEGPLQVCTGRAPTGADRKPLVSWAALLDEAVKKPGFIHEAYSRFHNYSLGNQLLALFQCFQRGIQPGPLATFPKCMLKFDYSEPDVRHRSDKVRASSLPASEFHNSGPPEDLLSRHKCQYAMERGPPVRNPASVTFKAQER